jgi:hypothetical protein
MFEILHLFIGDDGILRQIKWLDRKDTDNEEEIYNWQWLPFGSDVVVLKNLDKSKSTKTSLYFDYAHVVYDNLRCTFTYNSESYLLNRSK